MQPAIVEVFDETMPEFAGAPDREIGDVSRKKFSPSSRRPVPGGAAKGGEDTGGSYD